MLHVELKRVATVNTSQPTKPVKTPSNVLLLLIFSEYREKKITTSATRRLTHHRRLWLAHCRVKRLPSSVPSIFYGPALHIRRKGGQVNPNPPTDCHQTGADFHASDARANAIFICLFFLGFLRPSSPSHRKAFQTKRPC